MLLGAVVGMLALALMRVAFVRPVSPPHYHANLAIMMDGQRLDLAGPQYMHESACAGGSRAQPAERVHLHAGNPDVVHVHDEGVTWGHLMANLGFGIGDAYFATDDGRLLTDRGDTTLTFVLNSDTIGSVYNTTIRSGDRLLISYGSESSTAVIREQFPIVASSAEEFNRRQDPAGCSGITKRSFWDRVRHAFIG